MNNEVLIRVESLKKKYCRSLKRSMLYGISDICKDIVGINNESNRLRNDEFWSLNDISFEVKRGECLGIIGANGAGKSTLLKLLNGIILPDSGKILIDGTVSSLIEVGAGFHPMLSGRENIYLNGSILGMSIDKIDKHFDSIVAFSELEDSIDMPVKHYSSGMYVRLGFAIAAHVKSDILILDEILAVGDMAFVAKCFNHLERIKSKTSVILVSHNMRNISRFCDHAIHMEKGKIAFQGSTSETISHFRKEMSSEKKLSESYNSEYIALTEVKAEKIVRQFDDTTIEIQIKAKKKTTFLVNIGIHREDGVHCCGLMSKLCLIDEPGKHRVKIILKRLELMPGKYYLTVLIWEENKTGILASQRNAQQFIVLGKEDTQGVYMPNYELENNICIK